MKKAINNLILIFIIFIPEKIVATCNTGEINTAFGCVQEGQGGLTQFIKGAFIWVASIIGALAILGMIYAGYIYITSAGNPEQISKAKDVITTSITSVIIILFSWALFSLLGLTQ